MFLLFTFEITTLYFIIFFITNFYFVFQHDVLQSKLSEIFNSLLIEPRSQSVSGGTPSDTKPSQTPAYEIHFPELFVY